MMTDCDDKGPPWTPARLSDPAVKEEILRNVLPKHPKLTRAEAIEALRAAGLDVDEVGG